MAGNSLQGVLTSYSTITRRCVGHEKKPAHKLILRDVSLIKGYPDWFRVAAGTRRELFPYFSSFRSVVRQEIARLA